MVEYFNILILIEDFYGKDFIKNLVNRLKREGVIGKNIKVDCQWSYGRLNPKITRILRSNADYVDRAIIVIDAEGENEEDVIRKLEELIPQEIEPKTKYIVFDYCIEEWICKGLSIRFNQDPIKSLSDYLRRKYGAHHSYKKYMLPDFAEEIDIEKLMDDQQFVRFLGYLKF